MAIKYKLVPADIEKPMEVKTLENYRLGDYESFQRLVAILNPSNDPSFIAERVRLGKFPGNIEFPDGTSQLVPGNGMLQMLVDEDGIRRQLPMNNRASWMYGTPYHGRAIYGDAILVSEVMTPEGPDFDDYPYDE